MTLFLLSCTDDRLAEVENPRIISDVRLESLHNVIEVSDGYVIAGMGDSKIIITKIDKDLNVVWKRNDISLGEIFKKGESDIVYSTEKILVKEKENGDLICFCLIKKVESNIDNYSTMVIRLDKSGNVICKKEFVKIIFATAATTVDDGCLLFCDGVTKLDKDFNIVSQNKDIYYAFSQSFVTESSDTGFVLKSVDRRMIQTVKLDEYGNFQWRKWSGKIFSSNTKIFDLRQLPNNDLIIIGGVNKVFIDDYDCFIMRTDRDGNVIWSKEFGTYSNEWLDKFLYVSENYFIVKEIIGLPDSPEREACLLEISGSGEILDACEKNVPNEYFYTTSDTYLDFQKNRDNIYTLEEIQSYLLFNYRY